MTLSALFYRCINHSYIHTRDSADYAYDRMNDRLILYFQDSDGLEDWKHNLDFPAVAYKQDGKTVWYAHRGFLKVWKSLIIFLKPLILDATLKQITVVGYSHGAALAILCHEYVWYHRPDLRDHLVGYGFGCPRVLWGNLSLEVSQRWNTFTVIRNLDDIVTHVPPRIFGYRHVGNLIEIGQTGKYSSIDAHRAENIREELYRFEANKDLVKMQG